MTTVRTGALDPGPPATAPEGGGGGWSWLMTARGSVEAALVGGVLDGAGIPVFLDRRDDSPSAWMFPAGNANAPVRVLVPATLLDAARLALMEVGMAASPAGGLERAARGGWSVWRWLVAAAVGAAVVWLVVLTFFAVSTCSMRLTC